MGTAARRVAAALVDVVDAFCVATLDEALALRRQVASRVIALYPVPAGAAAEAVAADVELTVMSRADLEAIVAACASQDRSAAVHLCLETGMNRGGLTTPGSLEVAALAVADPRIVLAGLWSHLASPEDVSASRQQVARFDEATAALDQARGRDRRRATSPPAAASSPGPRRPSTSSGRASPCTASSTSDSRSRPAHGTRRASCGRP